MFNKLHVNTLVNIGFSTVIILVTVLMLISQIMLSKIETDSNKITSMRTPTVKASSSMNIALNSSLAALRGWMLLEEERFLLVRRDSWQTIRQNEKQLLTLSQEWTNPQNKELLPRIIELLDQLEIEQTNIELLAHKPENVHSTEILFNSAAPLAASIADNITKMIHFTKTQQLTKQRLDILATMAEFHGSFGLSLADIRAFLLSGEKQFKTSFELHWSKNEKSYKQLILLAEHLTPFEQSLLEEITMNREAFQPLSEEMFISRQSKEWNQANYLLKTTAAQTANELVEILKKMVTNQNSLLEKDALFLSKSMGKMKTFQIGFFSFFLLITFYFATIINRKYKVFSHDLENRNNLIDQNVLMAEHDQDGTIISISNALCRKLGGLQKDFIGTQSHFFLPIDDNSSLHNEILESLMTGQTWQGEFQRDTLKNQNIWFSSTIIPITTKKGKKLYHNILEDITSRKHIEEVSVTDQLTSLLNRRKFDETIDHEIKLARRRKKNFTLAILDIDFFKKYNDTYGHPAGDTALVRTASAIKSNFSRPDDYVFRLGGEEFGIIFNSLDKKQSSEMLDRVRKSVEHLKIKHSQNEVSDYVTISIGAKVCGVDELIEKDILYNEADRVLYSAKQTRNTVVVN